MPALGQNLTMNRRNAPTSGKSRGRDENTSPRGHGPNGTENSTILFEAGWRKVDEVLLSPLLQAVKASRGDNYAIKRLFKAPELASLYTHVYTMCTQKAPHNWSGKLYFEYRQHLNIHLENNVLPNLQRLAESSTETPGDSVRLLTLVDQIWKNHCLYVKWSIKLLHYLDRFYVKRLAVDDLQTVTLKCFKEKVYDAVRSEITAAYVNVVSSERSASISKVTHDNMLERITAMYMKLGRGTTRVYENDLEIAL